MQQRQRLSVHSALASIDLSSQAILALPYFPFFCCSQYYFAFQFFKNLHGVTTSPLGAMFTGIEAGVVTVLSTCKPRGLTRYGWQRQQAERRGRRAEPTAALP